MTTQSLHLPDGDDFSILPLYALHQYSAQETANSRDLYSIEVASATTSSIRKSLFDQQQQQIPWKPRVVQLVPWMDDGKPLPIGGSSSWFFMEDKPLIRVRRVEALAETALCCSNDDESSAANLRPFARRFFEECVPMVAWHSQSFPVCNILHELDVAADSHNDNKRQTLTEHLSLLTTQGSWRSVWKLRRQIHTTNETAVLKLLKLHREFNDESYENHRIDALAMERLTKSPHIVDIFAFCGQSVLTEFATGSARALVKNESLPTLERLKIGLSIAQAVSALHSIDYPNATNVTLTHNDMNMANAVEVSGRIKLNDFNIGVLQRWNTTSNSICQSPVRFEAPLWKSPEEIRNDSYVDAAATDVYGLGNLLFHVLTRRQPWTHLEPNGPLTSLEVKEKKLKGDQPFVPSKYTAQNTTKIGLKALHYAVMQCFQNDPVKRPTSHQIAQELDMVVQWIQKQKRTRLGIPLIRPRDG